MSIYFNPLRPCGRRPLTTKEPPEPSNISIHSARVGGDGKRARLVKINLYFNPLRPCGRRPGRRQHSNRFQIFQSTPPVWAETLRAIHPIPVVNIFQSTPPVWAETRPVLQFSAVAYISIHSARVGGDPFWSACAPPRAYFNPLRPCGRRLQDTHTPGHWLKFQSTPPVWAETLLPPLSAVCYFISIHSARVGGDGKAVYNPAPASRFQSTPPVWAETCFLRMVLVHS